MFEHLENALCEELTRLDEKYVNGNEISSGDLAKADLIWHALKSAAGYKALTEGDYEARSERSYGGSYGNGSYARGRSPSTGRYVSRMGGGSGTYPRDMIDPYWDRR